MTKILTGYTITTLESNDNVIELSEDLIKKLDMNNKKIVTLKFGNLSSRANIKRLSSPALPDIEIRMSKKLFTDLKMPETCNLSLKYTGDCELRMGPVIGILTFRRIIELKRLSHYINYHRHLDNGLLFVFGSQGINPITKSVTGYYYNDSAKTWEQAVLPYPDAVIDLCYPNAYRAHLLLEKVLGTGRIFNKKTMINKLDFYNALKDHSVLANHLPDTSELTKTADLEKFLTRYGEVFIKPVYGMQGRGIVKLLLQKNLVHCFYRMNKENIQARMDPNEIADVLHNITSNKSRYIIQNAIPRLEYKGNPFCFRTVVCKNGDGEWVAPAIFPKAAPENGFLTNHASGARFVPLKTLFSEIGCKLPYTKAEFINKLVDLSVKTAYALDQKYGPLGKLGIDTVIDQSGKLWLLEANGNPGPVPGAHLVEFPHWSYQTFRLPLAYASRLGGFNS